MKGLHWEELWGGGVMEAADMLVDDVGGGKLLTLLKEECGRMLLS